ncbi:coiled-coil domain-containing protein 138 isoform X1 [Microcaecilia unicolor]|uniref:Coiled-coil domain-containing protein 138 isoform X1 n=1 Tax=Microcaecilia unicolor TaxID=1415580 RepID=A0A6P7XXR5_9AMPH|nr:coiled-coil domain-containing protein 138 isoform X1 [Microcaecilia unicolor]
MAKERGCAALDLTLERLKRRYLPDGSEEEEEDCPSGELQNKSRGRRSLTYWGGLDNFPDSSNIVVSPNVSLSGLTAHERKYYNKILHELFKNADGIQKRMDLNKRDPGNGSVDFDYRTDKVHDTWTQVNTETDVTLPSHLAANTVTCTEHSTENSPLRIKKKSKRQGARSSVPSDVSSIYDELLLINQKLQQESAAHHEYALQIKKREHVLNEREALLLRHQTTLNKIRGVEEDVHAKFGIMKEQHEAEVKQLSETLKEKIKENKRLKSSFDTLKDLNDSLKKELTDVSEQNKKLEIQTRKVQARLENLQRKHTFLMVQKCKDNTVQASQEMKPSKQEKTHLTTKTSKVPLNTQVYELSSALMDWISDHQLNKIWPEDIKSNEKLMCMCTAPKHYMLEKCARLLCMVAEQLQWMPLVNSKLHLPFVKFTYWAIRQLDSGTQQTAMTTTMRRLGEEIFKGTVIRGNQSGLEAVTESKPKSAAFFKSPVLHIRFVSTLIVIKTITQADYLAQAFDSLCMDLKMDEGKALFLEYQAVTVILNHLKMSSKGLLSSVIDVLLQMTVESCFLQPFLDTCSNELFFHTCSTLLRSPKVDLQILEKLSILLQNFLKSKAIRSCLNSLLFI